VSHFTIAQTNPCDCKHFPLAPQTSITTMDKCQQSRPSNFLGAMIHRTSLIYRYLALVQPTLGCRVMLMMEHTPLFMARYFRQALLSLWDFFYPYPTQDSTSVTVFCGCISQARTQQETFDETNALYNVGIIFIAHILSLKSISRKWILLWTKIAFLWNDSHCIIRYQTPPCMWLVIWPT